MAVDVRTPAEDSFLDQLDELLAEPGAAAQHREQVAFLEATRGTDGQIVLFGAGGFGRRTLASMRRTGLQPIAFADNNSKLWGSEVEGVPVYSVAEAAQRFGRAAVFLVTVWNSRAGDTMRERIQHLREHGCECVLPAGFLFWRYPQEFLPYYLIDLPHKLLSSAPEVRAAFRLFADSASRREYLAQVALRLRLHYDDLGWPATFDRYFPSELISLHDDETFVDCGAFDGDTLEGFIADHGNAFRAAVAFEPDPLNWEKLQARIARFATGVQEKIFCFPNALGSQEGTVLFAADGTQNSRMGQGALSVECVTLDHALREFSPTLIKFDIEGAELDALAGARETTLRCRPAYAVSAYHLQDHLWKVPLALSRLCEDYRMFLRPHGTEGWDLICYAIPAERCSAPVCQDPGS